jgi:hypothetical protein
MKAKIEELEHHVSELERDIRRLAGALVDAERRILEMGGGAPDPAYLDVESIIYVTTGSGWIAIQDCGDSTGRRPQLHQICRVDQAADLVNAIIEATNLKLRAIKVG